MSLIDTDGRSSRFRTRAQNRAITIESAPRSSKKLPSTDTCSTFSTPGQHVGQYRTAAVGASAAGAGTTAGAVG